MKCPHCGIGIRFEPVAQTVHPPRSPATDELGYEVLQGKCPECEGLIVQLRRGDYRWEEAGGELVRVSREDILYPRTTARSIDREVPEQYRDAFNEANAVMAVSLKASATLSRRLLQQLLRNELKVKRQTLNDEIDAFMQLPGVPQDIVSAVDAVRNVGNYAAHPTKYRNTGEIVDVESGEAEWVLDVLEQMLDYLFVQPKRAAVRKDALNAKLKALGKPTMKE